MHSAPEVTASTPHAGIRSRWFLLAFGLFIIVSALSIVGICVILLSGRAAASHDFISYWAAGQQLVRGRNPYDPQAILALERSGGFSTQDRVLIMRNPPWALFLTIPLGLLPAREASLLWAALMAACLILSIELMRRMVFGSDRLYVVGYGFAPALACMATGQTGIFSLLGLVLFLYFLKDRPMLAGASLSLCALKPHLFLPFACVQLVWIIVHRSYRILGGITIALATQFLIALAFDQSVWTHYRAMMHAEVMIGEFVPALGVLLQLALHREALWLQFVPAALACVWGLWYFRAHFAHWDWLEHGSLLILVSLVAAPYAWFTDQAIALVPMLFALRKNSGALPLLLAIMSAGSIEMLAHVPLHSQIYLWQGLAWLGCYLYMTRFMREAQT
jgi:hypothetical protein